MAKILPFPSQPKQASEMVEEIISSRMPDKHPAIQRCLKIEMTELVKKYFPGEQLNLTLELPRDLSDEQYQLVEEGIRQTINDHNRHMNHRANQLFFDLCLSRMAICELRHKLDKNQ